MQDFIKYQGKSFTTEESITRSKEYYQFIDKRRSVRHFCDKNVPQSIIEDIIMTASSAPSGAHKQPWFFAAINNTEIKARIREAAEKEEYQNYHGRMSDSWMKDLEPFGTDWKKEFIDIAPWLIIVFKKPYEIEGTEKKQNYYVNESVGIATGFLISAIHNAGLVTLTHTPSPMRFLEKILERPSNERAYLLIPVGYPADDAKIPILDRKSLSEVSKFY